MIKYYNCEDTVFLKTTDLYVMMVTSTSIMKLPGGGGDVAIYKHYPEMTEEEFNIELKKAKKNILG
jgi:hypothetical protein